MLLSSLPTSAVWRARDLHAPDSQRQASGFADLDSLLHGGWPLAGMVELCCGTSGMGELRCLLPLLSQQVAVNKDTDSLQIWINPPDSINAQALAQANLDLSRLLIVRCQNPKDALWAAEQSLNSGCTQWVLLWAKQMKTSQAKRLQWAAKDNQALLFWLNQQTQPDPSTLPISARLALSPHSQGVHIQVHKLQGQWPAAPVTINLHDMWPMLHSPPLHDNIIPFSTAAVNR